MARKSKYETHVEPNMELITCWARDGYTDEQIAKKLGIAYSTFRVYIKQYVALSAALKESKEVADYKVAQTLYESALSGNVASMIFWLKNRNPDKWKDRKEASEIELAKKELDLKIAQYEEEKARLADEQAEQIETFALPATLIAPPFIEPLLAITEKEYQEYVFSGGRGSTKSTFVSLEIIDRIISDEELNAVVMRQVANTLRDSVYAQLTWAIEKLGLTDKFKFSLSPLEITYKPTGQKIFFRGADEPTKLKGIKVSKGYIGILWLEELDQFKGPESVRTIEQSVIRGGDDAYIFKSFNPPKTKNNWANKYLDVPKANRLVVHSDYTMVPKKWLGKAFIDEAEHLKQVNPSAYEHEYLGIPNGNGGNVFDNVVAEAIPQAVIDQFDSICNGVDWGWYPDPWAFVRVYHDPARNYLYIFEEMRANRKSNKETAEMLLERIDGDDLVTCDSAENKSIQDYRSYGLNARPASKGPGSVEYSVKWLQSMTKIIIDPERCPHTLMEFLEYEYERDKDGNVISCFVDANNHHIDAVRYATNSIWKRKGQ
ncbi:MAG: PBSX family phage terminase large subunit [Culicoidibacterales bacterium]